jgi:hypothetical protein
LLDATRPEDNVVREAAGVPTGTLIRPSGVRTMPLSLAKID